MAFVFYTLSQQNQHATKPIMKSKNKSPFATICILLFHLGLLYLVYEKIAEQQQPKPKVQSEMQTNLP